MKNNQTIEKAKVGDVKMYQGVQYYVHALNAKGQPLWRKVGNKKTGENSSAPSGSGKSAPAAPATGDSAANNEENNKPAATAPAAKQPAKYDAPTPKVQYKTVKPADGVVVRVPETWEGKSQGGKVNIQHRSKFRELYSDHSRKPDDKVIEMVNNKKASAFVRQIAYEEALARGISESKLDPSGSLQDWWDRLEAQKRLLEGVPDDADNEEEYEVYDMDALQGMDVDAFMEKFPKGDTGWDNPNDDRVQKEFNKLTTLSDRQRYDAFLDYQRRKDPLYKSPRQKIQTLNRQLYFFMKAKKRPMFVSAGGAGAGKTTSFLKVAKDAALTEFDPKNNKPGDNDYDFVILEKDVENEADLRDILAKHNGKLIVFDDKDKLLTSTSSPTVSLMKSLADGNPSMRRFKNPVTGEADKFTGQLLFITNKTMDRLNKDEDHVAIMSRASKNDIQFTINEMLEVLADRYKTMGPHMVSVDATEEAKIREKLFKTIKDNRAELDPDKFTVRKFEEALEYIDGIEETNRLDDEESDSLYGEDVDWTKTIVRDVLNKAEVDNILEKGISEEIAELGDEESKKSMIALYKKNPKRALELFGEEILEIVREGKKGGDDDTDEKIAKSFMDSLGGMSIEEAEQILEL